MMVVMMNSSSSTCDIGDRDISSQGVVACGIVGSSTISISSTIGSTCVVDREVR